MHVPSPDEVRARVLAVRAREADGSMELLGASHQDPVELVQPDAGWSARFRETRLRIAEALGEAAQRIDHVGSTAIADIPTKPILDVQVSVVDLADEAGYAPALSTLGWPLRLREEDHRFFREPAGQRRTTHIHVCRLGGEWEWRHLLFRDYLRAHPDRAAAYGSLKLALAKRYRHDRVSYTEAKGPFIDETLALATAWASVTGWRP